MTSEAQGSNYYQENYGNYDAQNSANKLDFYLSVLDRYIARGETLFELGVGQGNFLKLASSRYITQGCDINEYGVEAAKQKLPHAEIAQGSVEKIPSSKDLKAVVSFDVLEHLPDLPQALHDIYSKLPKGAFLIGVVPVYDGPLGWLVRLLDKDPTHLTKTSRRAWLELLKSCGFNIVESGGILRKLVGRHYFHIVRPQWLLKSTGTALYFVASK